jgi:hypothetical protein
LPILSITARSYAFLWREWRSLALPVLSLIVLMSVIPNPYSLDLGDWIMVLIALTPTALFMPALEVGLFRRLVLGEPRRNFTLFCLNRALVTYSVVGIKLFLCLTLACLPTLLLLGNSYLDGLEGESNGSMTTDILPGLLVGAAALLLVFRLAPVLPAAAIGIPLNFRQAWTLTKGNGLRLVAIVMLTVIVPLAIPALLPGQSGFFSVLSAILQALAVPVRVMALSLSYRFLTEPAISEASAIP